MDTPSKPPLNLSLSIQRLVWLSDLIGKLPFFSDWQFNVEATTTQSRENKRQWNVQPWIGLSFPTLTPKAQVEVGAERL